MSNKVTINPSIAAIVDIDSVSEVEVAKIIFTADENWEGDFELTVFNSIAKNSTKVVDALEVAANVITWTIDAETQDLLAGTHYYEIFSTEAKRIIFKGKLIITE